MKLTPQIESEMTSDHNSPYVNLTMPAVDKRDYAEHIFKAQQEDWPAVERIAAQFRAETGEGSNPGAFGEAGEVWLIPSRNSHRANYTLVAGAAHMEQVGKEWILAWWWVHPNERGSGLSGQFWTNLEARFENFWIELPTTKTMSRFIEKYDQAGNHRLGNRRSS